MNDIVYDKAKYHYDAGNFPKSLPRFQAFIHTGFFLGWLVKNDLVSEAYKKDFTSEIKEFLEGTISAPRLFQRMDGVLTSGDLNEQGNNFAKQYFDLQNGRYFHDYEVAFPETNSLYLVKDTSQNFQRIENIIEKRYAEWKVQQD